MLDDEEEGLIPQLLLLPLPPPMTIFARHWLLDEELLFVDGCPRMCCCWLVWLDPIHIPVDWCCCDLELLLVDCFTSAVSSSLSEMVMTAVGEGVSWMVIVCCLLLWLLL